MAAATAATATAATAAATAAATTTKPQLSALKTCASSTYPSELRSPFPDTPKSIIKCEEVVEPLDDKTPMTPPVAYVDFLKALSPALSSPATTPSNRHFTFAGVGKEEKTSSGLPIFSAGLPTSKSLGSGPFAPTSVPSSSTSSSFSVPSGSSGVTSGSFSRPPPPSSSTSSSSVSTTASSYKGTVPSPFVRPRSATVKAPWRLHIPQSPYSPVRSPLSARSMVMSSSSITSPQDWYSVDGRRIGNVPVSANGNVTPTSRTASSMSVRRVVTRKVTYARTPIEPAPRGKRRRVGEES